MTRARALGRKAPYGLALLLVLAVTLRDTERGDAGSGEGRRAGGPLRFRGERAYALLESLCALGPRVPGRPAHRQARDFLIAQLRPHAGRLELEEFPAPHPPYAAGVTLTNIIARFAPERTPRMLIGAHWDSRPWADEDPDSTRRRTPVLGANDSASGCAILLHLAELLDVRPPAIGVDLVFFDGEDGGQPGSPATYCLGSREHVRRLRASRPAYAINLDMVGDRELALPVEGVSLAYAPQLVKMVWGRAERLGLTAFTSEPRGEVIDDHLPFLEAGIPAVDVIDFDYPYWHTTADTPDKCSAQSLEVVGELMQSLIYEP